MEQALIFNTLCRGIENAKHLQELSKEWGISQSGVKKVIREARMQGVEICSGSEGYWIAADIVDRNNFVHSLKKQGIERFKTARAIKSTNRQIEGQISLNFEQMGVSNQ